MFSEIEYSIEQQDLIECLNPLKSTYAIDITILESDESIIDIYKSSLEAALTGIQIFSKRVKNHYFVYTDVTPVAQEISFSEFIGNGVDIETLRLTKRDFNSKNNEGLAYALFCTPYRSWEVSNEDNLLFRKFLSVFIFVPPIIETKYIIYKWSDDWSNYFDVGKEWWGTFFWTLYDKTTNHITVIAASTTD
ncbi:hypothetical protein CAP35_12045 [Chitinophagaceae bacterium IBVUCB1]|nr:hypothetical protein CAP35_12045 [Chitinophagaceae bacterium IBVUCB1]